MRNWIFSFVLCVLCGVGLGLPDTGSAQDETPDYTRSGPYVTVGAGRANNGFGTADSEALYRPSATSSDVCDGHKYLKHCLRLWDYDLLGHVNTEVQDSETFRAEHRVLSQFSDSSTFGGAVGYRLNPTFAVELRFDRIKGFRSEGLTFPEDIGHPDVETEPDFEHGPVSFWDDEACVANCEHELATEAKLKAWTGVLQGKAFLPLGSGRFQPYAVAGVGIINARLSAHTQHRGTQHELLWRYGAGLDFYTSENLVIGTEISHNVPTGDLRGFDYWHGGVNLTYRF